MPLFVLFDSASGRRNFDFRTSKSPKMGLHVADEAPNGTSDAHGRARSACRVILSTRTRGRTLKAAWKSGGGPPDHRGVVSWVSTRARAPECATTPDRREFARYRPHVYPIKPRRLSARGLGPDDPRAHFDQTHGRFACEKASYFHT